jgi:predicted anti-sigma-YlaC factor YlaD
MHTPGDPARAPVGDRCTLEERMSRSRSAFGRGFACLFLAFTVSSCSVRTMAITAVADGFSSTGTAFASDDDPELVRAATPFALKTLEILLEERPSHPGLLLAAARGFTQYAYAFVETDALLLEEEDPARSREGLNRAARLYLRARDYGLRGLEVARPGASAALRVAPDAAASFGRTQLDLLYWTAAAWGAAIALGMEDPALIADFPVVQALAWRAAELDPDWDGGAIHELLVSIESVPELMGGSEERARWHFERAVRLSEGRRAGPFVSLAGGLAVARQDRREFDALLDAALAVDPDAEPPLRLANLIAQKRARHLRGRADRLFLDDEPPGSGEEMES